MDAHNLFLTPTTYRLLRLEYLVGLVVSVVLLALNLSEVRWVPFIVLFAYIDVIGYLPGLVAHHRRGGAVPRVCYVLYNTMHSLVTASLVAGLWLWLVGPEWALVALPIHLFGDRALFGNFLKPFGVAFEPRTHPAYTAFRARYDAGEQDDEPVPAPVGAGAS